MAHQEHSYQVSVTWSGNLGKGTATYGAYSRDHMINVEGKPVIPGSSDPAFRGDAKRYNPEELFLSSLSACHMLWYLHLCAEAGIAVTAYSDAASGSMKTEPDGNGRFTRVVLHPVVTITDASKATPAMELHKQAQRFCFIANSVSFPVEHQPEIIVNQEDGNFY
ncbi:OsmC family protein [Niabella drilacis]|uniref:Organic hydroperoxide reductase OsmC/OhrA n=1 Tax=Niabella drilacis (strain DSM 25811 / CCM 8410 / CCUG 62505 / LMG 26954 / E90) TaxID=1285928 RepID=A0A1G6SF41_NIADE|nr:OsmC family protein [Niabella drilacis]SDD15284.1 Organic hydroperoxide reductase OsmC/OhrA [Niabella drilacis]